MSFCSSAYFLDKLFHRVHVHARGPTQITIESTHLKHPWRCIIKATPTKNQWQKQRPISLHRIALSVSKLQLWCQQIQSNPLYIIQADWPHRYRHLKSTVPGDSSSFCQKLKACRVFLTTRRRLSKHEQKQKPSQARKCSSLQVLDKFCCKCCPSAVQVLSFLHVNPVISIETHSETTSDFRSTPWLNVKYPINIIYTYIYKYPSNKSFFEDRLCTENMATLALALLHMRQHFGIQKKTECLQNSLNYL